MALIWPLNRNLIWDAIGNEVLLEMKKTIICVMLTLAALIGFSACEKERNDTGKVIARTPGQVDQTCIDLPE